MNLKGKSFLKLLDFTADEINYLIDLAAKLKAEKKSNGETEYTVILYPDAMNKLLPSDNEVSINIKIKVPEGTDIKVNVDQ